MFQFARTVSALRQYARQKNVSDDALARVIMELQSLLQMTGEASLTRPMALKIGQVLLDGSHAILIPLCHAWETPRSEKDVAETTVLHLDHLEEFVATAQQIVPALKPVFLIADTEAEDECVLKMLRCSHQDLLARLAEEQERILSLMKKHQWEVLLMSDYIPDILVREKAARQELTVSAELRPRLVTLTMERSRTYDAMGIPSGEDRLARTIWVAGQYKALAEFADANRVLVCSHATQNSVWYREAGTAVLYGPF